MRLYFNYELIVNKFIVNKIYNIYYKLIYNVKFM